MNANQKQRIAQAVSNWRSYDLQEAETVTEDELSAMCSSMAALLQELVDAPEPEPENAKWRLGDLVQKVRGSKWRGKVVGFYSTEATPIGYSVESAFEPGSVQVWPEAALIEWDGAK